MGDSYCKASKATDGSEVVCKGVVYGRYYIHTRHTNSTGGSMQE